MNEQCINAIREAGEYNFITARIRANSRLGQNSLTWPYLPTSHTLCLLKSSLVRAFVLGDEVILTWCSDSPVLKVRMHRTIVQIIAIDLQSLTLALVVPSWDEDCIVNVSLGLLPSKVTQAVLTEDAELLFASINTGAVFADDLVFTEFELT